MLFAFKRANQHVAFNLDTQLFVKLFGGANSWSMILYLLFPAEFISYPLNYITFLNYMERDGLFL